mmetsp:Transcript_33804/g.72049  ORF Transcript_33804/g.72049 Transcript_33804/m.72049 type:complete len:245 (-) Transcript_33804:1437-2171(-)
MSQIQEILQRLLVVRRSAEPRLELPHELARLQGGGHEQHSQIDSVFVPRCHERAARLVQVAKEMLPPVDFQVREPGVAVEPHDPVDVCRVQRAIYQRPLGDVSLFVSSVGGRQYAGGVPLFAERPLVGSRGLDELGALTFRGEARRDDGQGRVVVRRFVTLLRRWFPQRRFPPWMPQLLVERAPVHDLARPPSDLVPPPLWPRARVRQRHDQFGEQRVRPAEPLPGEFVGVVGVERLVHPPGPS